MPRAILDGISTEYQIVGTGPPVLFFSPGGFDATMDKWWSIGTYAQTLPVEHLSSDHSCILFDRRECGSSDGRVERITWDDYARQGLELLDHLDIKQAVIIGGCMGVSAALALACRAPSRARGLILYWPVGGARYRINGNRRFADHLAFARREGLDAVVALVTDKRNSFSRDPRGGPWASAILHSEDFAEVYRRMDIEHYSLIVTGMVRCLLDRDTAPGAEPEDLLRCELPALIIPGDDAAHARSASHYLAECLPKATLWDAPTADQTKETVGKEIRAFVEGLPT